MTAGMADVIAAHAGYDTHWEDRDGVQVWYTVCDGCDWRHDVVGRDAPADTHAAHVAEELGKAGYGDVREAKRDALLEEAEVFGAGAWNDAYIIGDVRDDADAAVATVAWLRERAAEYAPDPLAAALADPEGHALVKAIHDRKVTT